MSSHQRAVRISSESAGASATLNGPQVVENDHASRHSISIEAYLETNPPSIDDIVKELEGKNLGEGLEKVEQRKKALIDKVILPFSSQTGTNILAVVKNWDPESALRLTNALPTTKAIKRSEFTKSVLAKCMLNIYNAMEPINEVITSGVLALKTTAQRDFWKAVFDDSICCWFTIAKDLAKNTLANKASSMHVALDATQIARRFKEAGFVWSDDPLETACVSCGHCYVDMPNECRDFPLRNEKMNEKYKAEVAEWQTKKARGEKNVGNKPRAPKQLVRHKHCHCAQFHCAGNRIGVTTRQCPILCINPSTNSPFTIVDGICQCYVCLCNCRLAIKVCCCQYCCVVLLTLHLIR